MLLIYMSYVLYDAYVTYFVYVIRVNFTNFHYKYYLIMYNVLECMGIPSYLIIYILLYVKNSNDPLEAIQILDFLKTLSLF
jgi:hypothetical protein